MTVVDDTFLFIFGDGDHVRTQIERYLLNNEFEQLSQLSQSLTEAIKEIKTIASTEMNAEVIMAGGDDILLRIQRGQYQRLQLERLANIYQQKVGATLSFGVGQTIETAFVNLRRAKASKDEKIVDKAADAA